MTARLQVAIRTDRLEHVKKYIANGSGLQGSVVCAIGRDYWKMETRLEILKIILEEGADPNQYENSFESSALTNATDRKGNAPVVDLLLKYGADPNIENGEPLINACRNADLQSVSLLLDAGADPKLSGRFGMWSPIEGICTVGWFGDHKLPKGKRKLQELCAEHEANIRGILSLLIEKGISVDDRNEFGDDPAEVAVLKNNYPAFEFLLEESSERAKVLLKRSIGKHIEPPMLYRVVVIGRKETYCGMILDVNQLLFGKSSREEFFPGRFAFRFEGIDTPSPMRGDIIYAAPFGGKSVSANYWVREIRKADRLPPYRDYLLVSEFDRFDQSKADELLRYYFDND